jgi:hypothetical protein
MWELLRKTFQEPHGFTVIFHLSSGHSFNVRMCEPKWRDDWTTRYIEGTVLVTDNPILIPATSIVAYEIEY